MQIDLAGYSADGRRFRRLRYSFGHVSNAFADHSVGSVFAVKSGCREHCNSDIAVLLVLTMVPTETDCVRLHETTEMHFVAEERIATCSAIPRYSSRSA